jgi:hypothetical protein
LDSIKAWVIRGSVSSLSLKHFGSKSTALGLSKIKAIIDLVLEEKEKFPLSLIFILQVDEVDNPIVIDG